MGYSYFETDERGNIKCNQFTIMRINKFEKKVRMVNTSVVVYDSLDECVTTHPNKKYFKVEKDSSGEITVIENVELVEKVKKSVEQHIRNRDRKINEPVKEKLRGVIGRIRKRRRR